MKWLAVFFIGVLVSLGFTPSADAADVCVPPIVCVPVPGPTVTIRVPVPQPPVTIRLPGNTVTLPGPTVVLPGPTVTAVGPGGTQTVYRTTTIRVPQNGTQSLTTVKITASGGGVQTKILTPTPRQTTPTSDTMVPKVDTPTVLTLPQLTVPQAIGLGTLALLGLILLAGLALFFGYGLGWKDRERKEKNFLAALSDSITYRKQH